MNVSAFDLAQRFVGIKEVPGTTANPLVLAMLQLDGEWPKDDAVPWCSAFTNFVTWLPRLPGSKSLAARSWLDIGGPLQLVDAIADSDVVVLRHPNGSHHVGFFAALHQDDVFILGGNQHNSVNVSSFAVATVIAGRRLIDVDENRRVVRE